jgi:protein TonB
MTDSVPSPAPILQTLLGDNAGVYRTRPANFLFGYLVQMAGLALLIALANYFSHNGVVRELGKVMPSFESISFAPTTEEPSGAGGGGEHEKLAASRGALPRITMQDQLTPPEAVIHNPDPKLPEPPSLRMLADAKLPQVGPLGDPLANVQAPPSNGPGDKSGTGAGCCGAAGPGNGTAFGDSVGNVYRPGMAGVTLPRALYDPDPEYSEEARKSKYQGSVVLRLVVDAEGRPRDLRVQRSLGMGLDEKALAAVSKWRFQPATLHGQPVAVQINVEVTFRLF